MKKRNIIPEGMIHLQVAMCKKCTHGDCDHCGGITGYAKHIKPPMEAEIPAAREYDSSKFSSMETESPTISANEFANFLSMETEIEGKSKTIKEWCWQRGLNAEEVYKMVANGSPLRGVLLASVNNRKGFTHPTLYKFRGEHYCVAAIAEITGLSKQTLQRTMHDFRMEAEQAVEYMIEQKKNKKARGNYYAY